MVERHENLVGLLPLHELKRSLPQTLFIKLKKCWNLFQADLLALMCGLRAAVLFDYVAVDGRELASYLDTLSKRLEAFDQLQVLEVEAAQFTFLINTKLISQLLSLNPVTAQSSVYPAFVNVAKETGTPRLCSASELHNVTTRLHAYLRQLSSCLARNSRYHTLALDGSFIVTFAGWILEYPVIYVLDTASGQQMPNSAKTFTSENCLAMVPLYVLSVRAPCRIVPPSTNPHVLLSFSLPVQVAETLQKSSSGIDKLLENLKGRMTQRILQNDAFKLWTPQPDVTEKVVVLRHVLL